ncbi:replication endonuclease [Aliivibrio sp. SR45-2]|uniref:replication endonuclease n=1 Tax=Aliivibrio sp. SR45-2 TaxID=2760931 RepID=UPI0015F902B7|nr:replication endonuclease [Aliivibrio sp. SR45-2]MBB1312521.1 replication endonuclease [Aliivibrio sp. SR45-2]
MKTYNTFTHNALQKLPVNLNKELLTYLENQVGTSQIECINGRFVHDGKQTPREKVFEFANQCANKFKLPADIRNYLDKASAIRFRKYGFKRAMAFIERRSAAVYAALAVLPEPYWKVDTEFKRARLADELVGRACLRLEVAAKHGFDVMETIDSINQYVGAAMWMPQFASAKNEDHAYSILVRLIDDAVWKRAIERQTIAAFENARRAAGMVSPHVSPYASYSACQWLKIRQDRQREWLQLMAIESEEGAVIPMEEVHQSSVSNPTNRRNELMTRIAGCQEYADSNNHIAVMITMTAAGKYHRLKQQGKYFIENDKWNGASAQDSHQWLSTSWIRFRSAADRAGLIYYGMRVVEPHVDGTPHWHGVFFMPLEHFREFKGLLEDYQYQRDSDELFFDDGTPKTKAMKARVDVKIIDRSKGDAVGYIAKYISKNVDGYGLEGLYDLDAKKINLQSTVQNVTAFSRAFSFRQFQFQKTPSVTVWRELRRIEEKQEYSLFEKARRAADMGFFSAFFDYMGGHRLSQRLRPIKMLKEQKENKYGEIVESVIGLIGDGLSVLTHEIEWKLIKKPTEAVLDLKAFASEALLSKRELAPWINGNNCTRADPPTRQQKIIANFFLNMELNGGGTPEWEEFMSRSDPEC